MVRTVTVSVVFTDLVDSTETSARLGRDEAEALRHTHFGLLREAVTLGGGTEVKNLGDGLMVVYDSLSAALDGAVLMQQAIVRYNDKGGIPLGVRVGVSTGDTTAEDGDYFGTPVVEAARLCAHAEGGQILTTQMVAMLARATSHQFSPIGEFQLKGLPEPVAAVDVAWTRAADPAGLQIPMPPRLATRTDTVVVGRHTELEVLEQALKSARAASRRVVLVAGEPGIGKTCLTSHACRIAFDTGAVVLYGRCDEDLGVPYQPWVEAITHLVEFLPDEALRAHVAGHGGELVRLVPLLARRLPDVPPAKATDPETERYLLFQAVAGLLGQTATNSPVVLLLDDLHWADKPSLMLLRHLVSLNADRAVLVLGTYRDSDLSNNSALTDTLAALRREPGVERMSLNGLDDAGVLALLELIAGHRVDDSGVSLARAIGHETAGNPFFVGEILRYLNEAGTIYQGADGRWFLREQGDQIFLPESVREVVGQRVGRLGPDAVRILSAASVIGRDFDLILLAHVLDEDEDEVYDHLAHACGAALIRDVVGARDRFTFRHALVQHALDSDLSERKRRQLHQRIAEVIEQECGDEPGDRIGELATHWLAATTPVAPAKALRYARLAGEHALGRLAPDEAVRWFTAALDVADQVDLQMAADELVPVSAHERCALLVGLGNAQRQSGDPAYRQTLLDCAALAQRVGDVGSLVTAALANNRGLPSIGGTADPDRVAVLRAAIEGVGPNDSAERARLLSLLATELAFTPPFEARAELAEEAVEIARRVGDPTTLAEVLIRPYLALMMPDTRDSRSARANEARELAARVNDPLLRFWTTVWSALSAIERADMNEYDELLAAACVIAESVRQPMLEWVVTYNRAMRACLAGDTEEAEAFANRAFELATEGGQPDAFIYYGTQLMSIRRFQGRSEELLPVIRQVSADNPTMIAYAGVLAANLTESGHLDEARAILDEHLESAFPVPQDVGWSNGLVSFASAAAALRHETAAAVLYDLLKPYETIVPTTSVNALPPLAVTLGELAGVLGDLTRAEDHFKVAEQISTDFEAPYFLARTHLAWAIALAHGGEPERSSGMATAALEDSAGRFGSIDRQASALIDSLR